jgi:hypothetical protein
MEMIMASKLEAEADAPRKMIGKKSLKDLVQFAEAQRGKIATATGHLGQKIAEAVENKNLHAPAFRQMIRLRKMDPLKLRSYLDAFDYYRDVLKLDDLKATSLFEDGGGDADDEAGESNVTSLREVVAKGDAHIAETAAKLTH